MTAATPVFVRAAAEERAKKNGGIPLDSES
jgi:hypothetical protein